jgi:hypothetical protein
MTYAVAVRLQRGLVFAADTRTNAGIDNISQFRKLHFWRSDWGSRSGAAHCRKPGDVPVSPPLRRNTIAAIAMSTTSKVPSIPFGALLYAMTTSDNPDFTANPAPVGVPTAAVPMRLKVTYRGGAPSQRLIPHFPQDRGTRSPFPPTRFSNSLRCIPAQERDRLRLRVDILRRRVDILPLYAWRASSFEEEAPPGQRRPKGYP